MNLTLTPREYGLLLYALRTVRDEVGSADRATREEAKDLMSRIYAAKEQQRPEMPKTTFADGRITP